MLVGYARVSSVGQSLDVQLEALQAAGCEKIFSEKRSGTSAVDRAELDAALSFVREGDTLVVTRLDRLARSAGDLHNIVRQLTSKGVAFQCMQQSGMDTSTSTGKLLPQFPNLKLTSGENGNERVLNEQRLRVSIKAANRRWMQSLCSN